MYIFMYQVSISPTFNSNDVNNWRVMAELCNFNIVISAFLSFFKCFSNACNAWRYLTFDEDYTVHLDYDIAFVGD